MIKRIKTWLRQRICRHQFDLAQLEMTGIPIPPPPPREASVTVHCDYLDSLWSHPSHTERVRWPCAKCGKVFHAHCGIEISSLQGRLAP